METKLIDSFSTEEYVLAGTTSVNGTMNGQSTQYISSAAYAPNGGLIGYFLNNGQLTLSTLYNMHQQMSHLAVAYNNNYQNQNYFYQKMDWGTSGNNGVRLSGKKEYISNNGPVPSTPTFSQTFGYDGVNRLTSASEAGGWSQSYGYDQYGNMWMPSNGLANTNSRRRAAMSIMRRITRTRISVMMRPGTRRRLDR
jgi:hypothetical protein